MGNVTELRIALTVEDFDRAVAFYRDALGLEQIADWSSATGRVVVLEAGRATPELFDSAPAESVVAIGAGPPGSRPGPGAPPGGRTGGMCAPAGCGPGRPGVRP